MIIYYHKRTGDVFGASHGYEAREDIYIKPDDVSMEDLGKIVVEKRWEKENPDTVRSILSKKVKDPSKLEFVEDERKAKRITKKKSGETPCQEKLRLYAKRIEELEREMLELRREDK